MLESGLDPAARGLRGAAPKIAFLLEVKVTDFNFGVVPRRCSTPSEAFSLLRSEGVAIVSGIGTAHEDARALAQHVLDPLAPVVPDPAPIKEGGGNRDRSYVTSNLGETFAVPFQSGHTDGFAYGNAYPDFIFLLCVRPAAVGGASFAVDTYAILDRLVASDRPDDAALAAFLQTVPIEQTEPGFVSSVGPAIGDNGRGRRMARWTPVQRPVAGLSADEHARQTAWLARWTELAHQASLAAPRFMLHAGDALCLDNYRLLHGRTGFDDTERSLWRIWAWTSEAPDVPGGLLFSDSRYAVTE